MSDNTSEQKYTHCFSFLGGCLNVKTSGYGKQNGTGEFVFSEDELEWDTNDETGRVSRWIKVEASELLAIRDFLNARFPPQAEAKGGEEGGEAPEQGCDSTGRFEGQKQH